MNRYETIAEQVDEACRVFITEADVTEDGYLLLAATTTDPAFEGIDWDGVASAVAAARLNRFDWARFTLRLDLCPIHECDVAICLDDADEECASLLTFFLGTDA